MSLRITCPHCGVRPLEEYLYGDVPVVPDDVIGDDARDLDRAFMRSNTEGVVKERWFHAMGCRRWLWADRDTRTDQLL